MTRQPKEVVLAMVDAYNAKSMDGVLELYDPDARYWDPLHRDGLVGRDGVADVLKSLFESFPDERMSIVTLAGDETHAVAELRSTATASATGEPFTLDFTEVYEVTAGRIVSCRVYLDPTELPGRPNSSAPTA
jgi:ketosteroid isomerase-like protein